MKILEVILAICLAGWLWYRINLFLYEHNLSLTRRTPKAEVQTMFYGNTKDQDQI
jgi:hypothetical protein